MGLLLTPLRGEGPSADAKYVGNKKCKSCHRAKSKGNQFGKWEESEHAKAFQTLASEQAKKAGKEKGIDDPQKSDQCLKCHVTAFGVEKSKVHRKFDPTLGVQCESCHGPGSEHAKARMVAAAESEDDEPPPPSAAELAKEIAKGDGKTCLKCHNKESPTYKEFNFEERWKEIAHPRP